MHKILFYGGGHSYGRSLVRAYDYWWDGVGNDSYY